MACQVTFVPASLVLLQEVVSITLPFDEATEALVGFESWLAGVSPVEKPKKISKEDRVEQTREENETYGAW